jgi:hypothetical protein
MSSRHPRRTLAVRIGAVAGATVVALAFSTAASAVNKPQITGIQYDDTTVDWDVFNAGDNLVLLGNHLGGPGCGLQVTIGDWQVRSQNTPSGGMFTFEGSPATAVTFPMPAVDPNTNYLVTYKLASRCAGASAGLAWSPKLLRLGAAPLGTLMRNSSKPDPTGSNLPGGQGSSQGSSQGADGPPALAVWTKTPVIKKGAKPSIEFGLRFLQQGRYTLILQQGYPGPRYTALPGTKVGYRTLAKPFTAPVKTSEVGLKSMIFKVKLAKPVPPGAVLRVVQGTQTGAVISHQVMGW